MGILTFVGISGCNLVIAVLDKEQLKGRGFIWGHSLKGNNPPSIKTSWWQETPWWREHEVTDYFGSSVRKQREMRPATGEKDQWLGAITILAEDMGFVTSTHMVANNHLSLQF